ncbi:MAG: hypothetical protein M3Y07_16285 [Acidobacteriota bacterium]|nr:hypothetical protein [Acidobacteriota bacterium]
MPARGSRKKAQETPFSEQILSQQTVVEKHEKGIRDGDASPKRAAALATAMRRLAEMKALLDRGAQA